MEHGVKILDGPVGEPRVELIWVELLDHIGTERQIFCTTVFPVMAFENSEPIEVTHWPVK